VSFAGVIPDFLLVDPRAVKVIACSHVALKGDLGWNKIGPAFCRLSLI